VAKKRKAVPMPRGVEIHHHDSSLEIVRRWADFRAWLMTPFTVALYGLLWYAHNADWGEFPRVFADLFVGVMTYLTAARWVNRTYIVVSKVRVMVRHRPLPYFGQKSIPAGDILRLHGNVTVGLGLDYHEETSYEINVLTCSGRVVRLVSGLASAEQQAVIAQEIAKYLGVDLAPPE
jgi:hypothetical protein